MASVGILVKAFYRKHKMHLLLGEVEETLGTFASDG